MRGQDEEGRGFVACRLVNCNPSSGIEKEKSVCTCSVCVLASAATDVEEIN